jgi:hypothetical protein
VRAAVILAVLAVVVVLAIVEWREHREHRTGRHVASRGPYGALRVVEAPRAEPPRAPDGFERELLLERCREADALPRGGAA